MKGSKANIRKVLNAADATDISEGRVSYWRYHEVLRNLAEFYGTPFDRTVAVFCSLSPNNDYKGNLRSAATVCKGYVHGVALDRIRVTTYNHCRDRAYAYLTGEAEFDSPARGQKILSFYKNIINPMDAQPVTIDGHAVNIWHAQKRNLKDVAIRRFKYDEVANDYRSVAHKAGLLPNQLQAITWFTWKRLHAILAPSRQLNLFEDVSNDLWQTLIEPASIECYPFLSGAPDKA